MTGKGHLWSGSMTLIGFGTLELFVVHPLVDDLIHSFDLESTNIFLRIYNHVLGYFSEPSLFNILIWICGICCYYFGLLLPDIDKSTSTISKILHFHLPFLHRGITHTIYWVILNMLLGVLLNPMFLFLAQGYFVHLYYDSFSVAGVCWFYPFSRYTVYRNTVMTRRRHMVLYSSDGGELLPLVISIIVSILIIVFVILVKGGYIAV